MKPRPTCSITATEAGRIAVSGALDLSTAAAALREGERLLAAHPQATVDLSAVTQADSAGLAVLIEWVKEAVNGGRQLEYRSMPTTLETIARMAGVQDVLSAASAPPRD